MQPGIVLFDLDGTLIDSAPDLCATANVLRERRGLPAMSYDALREYAGKGVRGLLWASLRLAPESPAFQAESHAFIEYYQEHLSDHLVVFKGVPELLARLEKEGIAWGIVTNKHAFLARPSVAAAGFPSRPACLVAGDMVVNRKPAPDPILLALSQTGFSADRAVYVGDDVRDIRAGHAAGMKAIAAAWGYTGDSGAVSGWQADAIANSPDDLLARIRELFPN